MEDGNVSRATVSLSADYCVVANSLLTHLNNNFGESIVFKHSFRSKYFLGWLLLQGRRAFRNASDVAFRDLITLHTLHVEVAVEVGWPGAVQEMQPAVGNFLVRVHVAVVVLVAVDELKQTNKKKRRQMPLKLVGVHVRRNCE